jgi:hypothetical protein
MRHRAWLVWVILAVPILAAIIFRLLTIGGVSGIAAADTPDNIRNARIFAEVSFAGFLASIFAAVAVIVVLIWTARRRRWQERKGFEVIQDSGEIG